MSKKRQFRRETIDIYSEILYSCLSEQHWTNVLELIGVGRWALSERYIKVLIDNELLTERRIGKGGRYRLVLTTKKGSSFLRVYTELIAMLSK